MRKLVLAASVALLAACSAPQQPQLNLQAESTLSTNNRARQDVQLNQ